MYTPGELKAKNVDNFADKHTTISHLLSQSYALRWQITVLFVTVNIAVGGFIGSYQVFTKLTPETLHKMFVTVALYITIFNFIWSMVVRRANQWVREYTLILRDLERTEDPNKDFKIFSHPRFFWHDPTTVEPSEIDQLTKVDGLRFTDATSLMIIITHGTWILIFLTSSIELLKPKFALLNMF